MGVHLNNYLIYTDIHVLPPPNSEGNIRQTEYPPIKPNNQVHRGSRSSQTQLLHMCNSAAALLLVRDAFSEQTANRTGEKRRGSIGNSFIVWQEKDVVNRANYLVKHEVRLFLTLHTAYKIIWAFPNID